MLQQKKTHNTKAGFTLIELLVVIAIIGMLAAVVTAFTNPARIRARDAKRTSDIREITKAIALWYDDNGDFPCLSWSTSQDSNFLGYLVNAGYLGDIPRDPLNNSDYSYEYHTFKNAAGGPCGQIAYIGYYYEEPNSQCPGGGQVAEVPNHCHVFFPDLLPCANNPLGDRTKPYGCAGPLED